MARINTVNLREAKNMATKILGAGLPLMLLSSPGCGKSSLAREIADKYKLEFIDIRLATHAPEDLEGLPRFVPNKYGTREKAEFVPFDLFPLEGDPLPEGKKGALILLDEITSCSRSMQVAAYRLLLDREVGQYKLHPACFLMAAGNRVEDNAAVNDLSTALKSRMITLRIEPDAEQWVEDYAVPHQLDYRIIGYVKANPGVLNDFDPDDDMDAFCCARSLDFLSRIIKGKNITSNDIPLIAGTIGDKRASEFYTVCILLNQCKVTIADVLSDPFLCDMPTGKDDERDTTIDWMFICSLAQYVTEERIKAELKAENNEPLNQKEEKLSEELQNIVHYVNRFDEPLRVVFMRMVYAQHQKTILQVKFFKDNVLSLYKNVTNFLGE